MQLPDWFVDCSRLLRLRQLLGGGAQRVALLFGRFEGPVPQRKQIVLRRRYWLYYVLTFMSGARRQLFVAFGGFLLVRASSAAWAAQVKFLAGEVRDRANQVLGIAAVREVRVVVQEGAGSH